MNKIITIFVLCLSFLCCKAQKVEPFKKLINLSLLIFQQVTSVLELEEIKRQKKSVKVFFPMNVFGRMSHIHISVYLIRGLNVLTHIH